MLNSLFIKKYESGYLRNVAKKLFLKTKNFLHFNAVYTEVPQHDVKESLSTRNIKNGEEAKQECLHRRKT